MNFVIRMLLFNINAKVYFLGAMICLAIQVVGQDVAAIDRWRGLEGMDFGDTYAEWHDKVELISQTDDGGFVYRLRQTPALNYVGYLVSTVDLEFKDDKLRAIRLFCPSWTVPPSDSATFYNQSADFSRCREALQSYGTPLTNAYGPASLTLGPQQAGSGSGTDPNTWVGTSYWKGQSTWIKLGIVYLPDQNSGNTYFSFEDRTVR